MKNCVFCDIANCVFENELAKCFYDINPESTGHMLFVTKRHVENIFLTTSEEKLALFDLIDKAKAMLDKKYHPSGYNICINCGQSAGQSVMHVHIHLIPRY